MKTLNIEYEDEVVNHYTFKQKSGWTVHLNPVTGLASHRIHTSGKYELFTDGKWVYSADLTDAYNLLRLTRGW